MKPLNAFRHANRPRIGLVFFILLLTLLLVECGHDEYYEGPPYCSTWGKYGFSFDHIWISGHSVYLRGTAFSEPPVSGCPVGADTSMTVNWTNQSNGASGAGELWYAWSTPGIIPISQCKHNWHASVPIVAGKNVIDVTVSGPNHSCTLSPVPDVQGPLDVLSTLPLWLADNVPINSTISATFNGQVDPQSVNSSSFILSSPYGTQTGSLTVSGSTVTFTPDNYLYGNTTYTATITTAVKDINGIVATNYIWKFTTGPGSDTTPPTVSSTSPTNNGTGVAVNSAITATFSEPMMASTVNAATFTLNHGVTGSVTYSGTTATFAPTSSLANSTIYTATITTGVRDAAANAMAAPFVWEFTTTATAPNVVSTNPINNASGVVTNTPITATFNRPMDASSITSATFSLNNGVSGTVTYSGTTATFTPTSYLAGSTIYTATITTGVKDAAGNAMAAPYSWIFTTGSGPDTTPPTVSSTSPANNAAGVIVNAITAIFSEPVDASTVNTATFFLSNSVTGTVTYSGTTAMFTPSSKLASSTSYTATITASVKDMIGNAMAVPYTWTFTTAPPGANFKMPDTNQTTCYDASGTVISCAGTGQDGVYIINPPSYTDNGDGTITDNVTGLVWQKQDDATARTWGNAITYCSNLTLAGQTGWRLPELIELISIVDYSVFYPGPAINTNYFPGTKSSYYWTYTTFPSDISVAWIVYFRSGLSDGVGRNSLEYVRCVRGG